MDELKQLTQALKYVSWELKRLNERIDRIYPEESEYPEFTDCVEIDWVTKLKKKSDVDPLAKARSMLKKYGDSNENE